MAFKARPRINRYKMKSTQSIIDPSMANDYVYHIYNNPEHFEFYIKTGIDLIVLSNIKSNIHILDSVLKKYKFNTVKDIELSKGKYQRKKIYTYKSSTIDILYKPILISEFYPTKSLIYFHQPDQATIDLMDSILSKLGEFPILSKIELDWDFYTVNVWGLKEFIERHLFLRYQRTGSRKYKTTYYTNNLRKSSCGVRIYPRPKDSDIIYFVRLELELHRPKIRKLGLYWPITGDQLADIDFFRIFDFRRLDEGRLVRYLVGQCRDQITRLNAKKRPSGDLVARTIESWVQCYEDRPLMENIDRLVVAL
jgi:hypothetical protein